ncbi:hypothetical protein CABS01_03000 [Colletotrichum abscissum]|uniref:uncharacterized protein n=1 Tax=Colletotrichum abscissum TaxID=1671311 RepID=UPI0027D72CFF|nr:uncharacterized protein CABS01_03000 [Colletotrichum abscissum]KAK1483264.1 hypothetical protein CABS01_03000 [Colletotrichum abscissum]
MPSPVVAPASVRRASHGGALAPSWLRIHVVVLTHPLNVPRYVSLPSTGLDARAPK